METQNNWCWKGPYEDFSSSIHQLEWDCWGLGFGNFQGTCSLCCTAQLESEPPVKHKPPSSESLVADRDNLQSRRSHTTISPASSQCWLMVQAWPAMTLLKTGFVPSFDARTQSLFCSCRFASWEGSFCLQKLQASSLACVEKKNYHFFVLVDSMYF